MHTRIVIICLLLLTNFGREGFAQQHHSKNFTTLDGLPNNSIRSLFLDSRGLLWIGTENGLSKMENNTFQNFDDSDGLAFNNCWAIMEDPLGQVWFGSYGGGVSYFDGRFFHALDSDDGLINDFVRELFYFEGKIWIGTDNGLSAIDIRTKEIISLEASLSDSPQSPVAGFFVHEGTLHYTTYGIGVYSIIPEAEDSFILTRVNKHKLIFVSEQIGDSVYLSNKGFFQIVQPKDLIAGNAIKEKLGHSIFWDYEEDREGNIYAAAWGVFNKDGGLYRLEGHRMVDQSEAFGIDSKVIVALAFDSKKNILYAGSHDKGLYAVRLNQSILYEHFGDKSVLGFGAIPANTAILHDHGLDILDTTGNLVHQVGRKQFKAFENAYLQKNRQNLPRYEDGFFELEFELPADDLEFYEIIPTDSSFYVSSNLGIYEVDEQGGLLTYLPVHTYVMGFTPDGRFIDSNPYHGVRIYDDPAAMAYTYFSDTLSYTPKQLSQIVTSPYKTYFASVFRGLYEYEESQFLNYFDHNIFSEEKIKALHLLDDYTLAIGAEFGDFYIAEDRDGFNITTTISREDIEGSNVQFLESWQGNLLIGTEKGLTIYKNGNIRFYDEEQGFKSKLFQSAIVLEDELWLGTSKGYYTVNLPGLLKQKEFPLELVITQLEINHRPEPQESFSWFSFQETEIEVPHNQNTIYLAFEPRGHQFPNKLHYRYRLKEEAEWSPVSKENTLSLPFLPPGIYPVEVEVTDRHTGINRVFPLLTIHVKSPFYLKPWFWMVLFAVFVAAVWSAYRGRIRRIQRREEIRTSIAKRLSETKLEALRSQMNPHFIFNAINSIQYFILKNDTDGALYFLLQFADVMRKTLDNSSKQVITLNEEIEYLKAYYSIANSRMDHRVRLEIHVDPALDPEKVSVPPMLLQPFVENAFMHAFDDSHENPLLSIDFKPGENNQLYCSIKDNGMGVQSQSQTKIHESKGKKLVKERLMLMEGAIENPLQISHSPVGTVVNVIIPLKGVFTATVNQ